jgi:phenylpropionate dioxygenase-like ring-hydroxylating dioxygenase large terminal subunit
MIVTDGPLVRGICEYVPTQAIVDALSKGDSSSFMKKACLKMYTIQEHKGLVWIWRSNVLEADAAKLPQTRKDSSTFPCNTILEYNVD